MRLLLSLLLVLFMLPVFAFCMSRVDEGNLIRLPQNQESDAGTGLESWTSLKREAGYYSETGRYRGGIYKLAIREDHETYECNTTNATRYCRSWTGQGPNTATTNKTSMCNCTNEINKNFCKSWSCERTHTSMTPCKSNDPNNQNCVEERTLKNNCSCTTSDPKALFCRTWNCWGDESNGEGQEEQDFECQLPRPNRGNYCHTWKGRVTSKREIQSLYCECNSHQRGFCLAWTCDTRALVRCSAHSGLWCNYWAAVLGGGAVGVFIIIAVSTFSLLMEEPHMALPLSLLALVLLVGVVIWGGVRALPLVGAVWFLAFLLPAWITCYQPLKGRRMRLAPWSRRKEPDLF